VKEIKLHIGCTALGNRIMAGNVLKDGYTLGANAKDVTGMACGAVAEHVLAAGGETIVTSNGKPIFNIKVERIGDEK
jgi:exopolysaccharide biosynthesis protein